MATDGTNQVVGLFRSQKRADAAVRALHQLGLSDEDIETGSPEPGRYGIEYDEGLEIGRGVTFGVLVGIPVGAIVSIGALLLLVPSLSVGASVGLGALIGGFWGIFFGGLGGMVPKVLAHASGHPTYAVSENSSDIVVIVEANNRRGASHSIMERNGALHFLTETPVVRHQHLALSAAH